MFYTIALQSFVKKCNRQELKGFKDLFKYCKNIKCLINCCSF